MGLVSECGKGSSVLVGWTSARGRGAILQLVPTTSLAFPVLTALGFQTNWIRVPLGPSWIFQESCLRVEHTDSIANLGAPFQHVVIILLLVSYQYQCQCQNKEDELGGKTQTCIVTRSSRTRVSKTCKFSSQILLPQTTGREKWEHRWTIFRGHNIRVPLGS